MSNDQVKRQAKLLAKENRHAEPNISKIYWFPDAHEVRLVELDKAVSKSDDKKLRPFYFKPAPKDQLPAPSAIALIHPDEYGKLELPEGWSDWDTSVELKDLD